MSHLEKIKTAIENIEENLRNELSVAQVADQSGLSRWEFQRVFKALTHHSIGDYIRKRRLTLAAEKLLETEERIIDIAIEFQFSSQEAFTRAFKKLFKMSPGEYRNQKIDLRSQKRVKISEDMLDHLSQGSIEEPEILDWPAFNLVGLVTKIHNHLDPDSDYHESLIPFWQSFLQLEKRLFKDTAKRFFGLAFTQTYSLEEDDLTYLAGVEVKSEVEAKEFIDQEPSLKFFEFPQKSFARFRKKGAAKETAYVANYIYSSWLPNSPYLRDETGNDFEIFDSRYKIGEDSSISDYFLPIKPREK